jgi:hypothetical protein
MKFGGRSFVNSKTGRIGYSDIMNSLDSFWHDDTKTDINLLEEQRYVVHIPDGQKVAIKSLHCIILQDDLSAHALFCYIKKGYRIINGDEAMSIMRVQDSISSYVKMPWSAL